MKSVWALARKEILLLARDRVAAGVLLIMPVVFVAVLGLILGENFGQKADDTLRVSIVDLDEGQSELREEGGKTVSWAHWVIKDLRETPGIRIETIPDRGTAERLIRDHRRASVLVLRPDFSERIARCSFLNTPGSYNPFHREGVHLKPTGEVDLGLEVLTDPTQQSASAINEQVVQVSMLRVLLPYMIGKAFNRLSDQEFIALLGEAVRLPMPEDFPVLVETAQALLGDARVKAARLFDKKLDATLKRLEDKLKTLAPLVKKDRLKLSEMIDLAAGKSPERARDFRKRVGDGVKDALRKQFSKYDLTGMTWEKLTKAKGADKGAIVTDYRDTEGSGLLRRGAARYQVLVPMYAVLFSFFLVLIVGWVFVGERRQGTLKRLRLAPITRGEILLGKLLPCYAISVIQGAGLLILGKLIFGMRWGPDGWSIWEQAGALLVVVLFTSMAAMGLAMLVASLARTEAQVALYGGVPVLVMAVIGGCVLPREMMPEQTQWLTLLTPHGWALNAYRELLGGTPDYEPNLWIIGRACAALAGFGAGFLAAAWALLRLD
jgi:ABC-type Na+ efflux pump permease subunit